MIYRSLKSFSLPQTCFILALIAIAYFISGLLGLLVAIPATNIAPLWPPSGVALAAILLFGYRAGIAIFIGSVTVNAYELMGISPNATFSQYATTCIMTGIGATLQATINAALLEYFIPKKFLFRDATSILKFFVIGMASCVINSNMGVLALIFNGLAPWRDYFNMWLTWWIGDITGVFVVAPFLLIWAQFPYPRLSAPKATEIFLMFVMTTSAALLIWTYHLRLPYFFIVCVIWSAIRFGFHGYTTMMVYISFLVVAITTRHIGPFAETFSNDALLYLAFFISMVSCICLIITAEFERRHSNSKQWTRTPQSLQQTMRSLYKRLRKRLKR